MSTKFFQIFSTENRLSNAGTSDSVRKAWITLKAGGGFGGKPMIPRRELKSAADKANSLSKDAGAAKDDVGGAHVAARDAHLEASKQFDRSAKSAKDPNSKQRFKGLSQFHKKIAADHDKKSFEHTDDKYGQ